MNTRDFIRQREKITRECKNERQRNNAMRRLVNQAGAVVVVIGGKVAGWRMKDGAMVCTKFRHKDQVSAELMLARAKASNWNHHRIPTRAYACPHCHGWHLTSQPAQYDQAA
ncbi:hypothetical protein CPT_Mano_045 [Achromobacter phage Mano]|uniref:Uncharacterized protein n=1 Tax=Achromobacter phage Mano TaxID=2767570 RepID=A0A7L8G6E3_9CAUD|nr:hypothetical protein KB680_gp46 [Achromobacter phage Mano]QOE32777.1 hypothetical protein CPT_Mano_045 [Achromobacter phage Mano]